MESEERTARQQTERRRYPRYAVDEDATLLLVNLGSAVACRVLEVGLGGCRVHSGQRFLAGVMIRVEVIFKVLGIAVRVPGVTQWTDRKQVIGIRFIDMTPRRQDPLAELLAEVGVRNAARAAKQATEDPASDRQFKPIPIPPSQIQPSPIKVAQAPQLQSVALQPKAKPNQAERARLTPPKQVQVQPQSAPVPAPAKPIPPAPPLPPDSPLKKTPDSPQTAEPAPHPSADSPVKRELRAQPRHTVDTSAVIYLINLAAVVHGRIVDLSLGGCCIRTDERFTVGIFRRVETEFRLEGLPFRLAGVTQAIYDRYTVGIRFLDMSERKREQLLQLIDEIEELRQREKLPPPRGIPSWRDEAGESATVEAEMP
jgi:hypothetical protein